MACVHRTNRCLWWKLLAIITKTNQLIQICDSLLVGIYDFNHNVDPANLPAFPYQVCITSELFLIDYLD